MHTTAKLIRVAIITAIIVVAGMLLLWKVTGNKPLPPDRAPANIEENAVINNEDDQQHVPTDGMTLNYTKDVSIDLAAKTATLHFENPTQSLYDAAIFLVIQDTVILQSGLLPPGSLLTNLSLPNDGVPLEVGGYDGAIIVQFYDEGGNALSVNAKIDGVNIEVK